MEFQILDELLGFLLTCKQHESTLIWQEANENSNSFFTTLRADFFFDALNKLVKDGYVEKTSTVVGKGLIFDQKWTEYHINFEGRVFISQGGYAAQQDRIRASENASAALLNEQRRQAHQILVLNRWVAAGTIVAGVYALFEIGKTFGIDFECWRCWF